MANDVFDGSDTPRLTFLSGFEVVAVAFASAVSKRTALIRAFIVKPSLKRTFTRAGRRFLQTDIFKLLTLTSQLTILLRFKVVPVAQTSAKGERLASIELVIVVKSRQGSATSTGHHRQEAKPGSIGLHAILHANILAVEAIAITAVAAVPKSTTTTQSHVEVPFDAEVAPGAGGVGFRA